MSNECSEEECAQEFEETEAISMAFSGMLWAVKEKLAATASPQHITLDGPWLSENNESRKAKTAYNRAASTCWKTTRLAQILGCIQQRNA